MKYLKVWVSFKKALEPFSDAEKGRLFDAMLEYADSGEEPHFTGNERFIWATVKQSIDLTMENSEKNRRNVKKRWDNAETCDDVQNDTKVYESIRNDTESNEEVRSDTYKEKKRNVKKSNNNQESENILPMKRFVPPKVEEIEAYCEERGVWLIDAQRFIDYYETRGWMLSKNRKMVDWRAAVRLWEKNERERKEKEQFAGADLPY